VGVQASRGPENGSLPASHANGSCLLFTLEILDLGRNFDKLRADDTTLEFAYNGENSPKHPCLVIFESSFATSSSIWTLLRSNVGQGSNAAQAYALIVEILLEFRGSNGVQGEHLTLRLAEACMPPCGTTIALQMYNLHRVHTQLPEGRCDGLVDPEFEEQQVHNILKFHSRCNSARQQSWLINVPLRSTTKIKAQSTLAGRRWTCLHRTHRCLSKPTSLTWHFLLKSRRAA
jgi:hypothetical protein